MNDLFEPDKFKYRFNVKFVRVLVLWTILLTLGFLYVETPKYKNYIDDSAHIYFFDVGQGDSILIKSPGTDRKLILVDGGPDRAVAHKISEVLPFWVTHIDLMVVTHAHADHFAGLLYILERYSVGCVSYDNIYEPYSLFESELRELFEFHDIQITTSLEVGRDGLIPKGCIDFNTENTKIKSYSMEWFKEINGNDFDLPVSQVRFDSNPNLKSLVTLFSYNDFDLLLLGDAEIVVQEVLLSVLPRDIEVLLVPHHGALNSYYPALLHKAKPDLAIVSAGRKNRYSLPNPIVMESYNRLDIPILQTAEFGTIRIRTNGNVWQVLD